MTGPFALGFSGGGDSTALLHALRALWPDRTLYALIVDHRLRPESTAEARQSAACAQALGAEPVVLTWDAPRPGQGAARTARHRLLAQACAARGVQLLCLAHTLDDRVETLRMRAARGGGWRTLTGMAALDPAPVWPEGRDLVLARPFLTLRRAELRLWLEQIGARWIDDPSNDDPAYERVRWRRRAFSPDSAAERALLALSDQAQAADRLMGAAAWRLVADASELTGWGGARLAASRFGAVAEPVALRALEALIVAVSGAPAPPRRAVLARMRQALVQGEAVTGGGVMLTQQGVLGRDPGAAAGRVDGAPGAPALALEAGEAGVFDGRWAVRAQAGPVRVQALGDAPPPDDAALSGVPAVLRSGLAVAVDPGTGAVHALPEVNGAHRDAMTLLCAHRLRRCLLPPEPPAWFDGMKPAAHLRAALAKSV